MSVPTANLIARAADTGIMLEHEDIASPDTTVLENADVDEKAPIPSPVRVKQIPLRYRLGALSMIIFITSGIEFAESTLGPLKHTLVTELKVNSEPDSDVTCWNQAHLARCSVWGDHHLD